MAKTRLISQDELRQKVSYDLATGIFTNKKTNKKLGTIDEYGYVRVCVDYVVYKSHRLAWLYMHGNFPNHQIDHIDHDRTNNKINNLRDVTHNENSKNLSISPLNKSGFTGICWCNTYMRWHARIYVNGKSIHIGYFLNKEEAINARNNANLKYKFHANHGSFQHKKMDA